MCSSTAIMRAPDRAQMEEDEAVLPLCLGEGYLGPALPGDAAVGGPGRGHAEQGRERHAEDQE